MALVIPGRTEAVWGDSRQSNFDDLSGVLLLAIVINWRKKIWWNQKRENEMQRRSARRAILTNRRCIEVHALSFLQSMQDEPAGGQERTGVIRLASVSMRAGQMNGAQKR